MTTTPHSEDADQPLKWKRYLAALIVIALIGGIASQAHYAGYVSITIPLGSRIAGIGASELTPPPDDNDKPAEKHRQSGKHAAADTHKRTQLAMAPPSEKPPVPPTPGQLP